MDETSFASLKDRARGDWIRFECHQLDFSDASRVARKRAEMLAWLTIILAGLATLTSGAVAQETGPIGWIATGLAALTTLVATVRQTFKWEEKAQQFHGRALEIRQLQRSLLDYLEAISRRNAEEEFTFLSSLNSRFDTMLHPEVDRPERFEDRAKAGWDGSHASRLALAAQQAPPPDAGAPPPEPEVPPPVAATGDEAVDAGQQAIEPIRRGIART